MEKSNKIMVVIVILICISIFFLNYLSSNATKSEKNNSVNEVLTMKKEIKELKKQIDILSSTKVNIITSTIVEDKKEKIIEPVNTCLPKNTEIIVTSPSVTITNKSIKKENYSSNRNINYFDIQKSSGLSKEEINGVLNYVIKDKYKQYNSKILNTSDSLYESENKYNVNLFFTLSVATFETQWGIKGVANQNNLFGITRGGYLEYEYPGLSILDFSKSIKTYYFDRGINTIDDIAPIYCPPNSYEWRSSVKEIMNIYIKLTKEYLNIK
jgi:hypothetical protein